MAARPKIYVTKNGKRYFIVNHQKIFISDMTNKEISKIYRLLKKSIPLGTKKITRRKRKKPQTVLG